MIDLEARGRPFRIIINKHCMHGSGRSQTETRCRVDCIIEVLSLCLPASDTSDSARQGHFPPTHPDNLRSAQLITEAGLTGKQSRLKNNDPAWCRPAVQLWQLLQKQRSCSQLVQRMSCKSVYWRELRMQQRAHVQIRLICEWYKGPVVFMLNDLV